jgi:predicted ATPase
LVGDQGCGKSTLIEIIKDASGNTKRLKPESLKHAKVEVATGRFPCGGFDFERDNFRIKSHFNENIDYMFQVVVHYKSHGQTNWKVIDSLHHTKGVIYLDEPDTALSIRSIRKLRQKLDEVTTDTQVLAVVHNPLLMEGLDVLSVEHRRWMPASEFIQLHSEACC